MVGATRGTPEGFRPDQASGSQQPPPAPPNLAEVMARQIELLNQLVQAQMGQFHHQPRGRDEPHQPVIKISSAPSLHCSIRQTNPSTLMLGSAPSSPSLHYCLPHVQMRTRRSLQPNNFVALPVCGGIITMLCSRLVMSSHGMNFGPLFEHTTFPKDSLSESSMNF
jgi:hypothetical protein